MALTLDEALKEIESLNKRLDVAHKMRGNIIKALAQEYARVYGQDSLDVAAKAQADAVRDFTRQWIKTHPVEPDARGAVDIATMMHTNGRVIGEVVERTPRRAVRHEKKCLFQDIWTEEMCMKFSHAMFDAVCQVVNPKLITYHTQVLSSGAPYCEIVFEMKE